VYDIGMALLRAVPALLRIWLLVCLMKPFRIGRSAAIVHRAVGMVLFLLSATYGSARGELSSSVGFAFEGIVSIGIFCNVFFFFSCNDLFLLFICVSLLCFTGRHCFIFGLCTLVSWHGI